jgi:hypothetical protein
MNSQRLFAIIALCALGYGAYAAYQWAKGDEGTVVKSTAKRTGSPVTKLTTETGKPPRREGPQAEPQGRRRHRGRGEGPREAVRSPSRKLDAKFATWRDDGRKAVEDMFGGDRQKIGEAFRAAMQNEEFRANFGRMRELEAQYRGASDDQKQGIMDELATIRARGLGMLKQAAAGAPASNQPTVTVTGRGVVTPATTNGPARLRRSTGPRPGCAGGLPVSPP